MATTSDPLYATSGFVPGMRLQTAFISESEVILAEHHRTTGPCLPLRRTVDDGTGHHSRGPGSGSGKTSYWAEAGY